MTKLNCLHIVEVRFAHIMITDTIIAERGTDAYYTDIIVT